LSITGSTVDISSDNNEAGVQIGRNSGATGQVRVDGGSQINLSSNRSYFTVSRNSGSVGSLSITSGSQLNVAGTTDSDILIGFAVDHDGDEGTPREGGVGTATVSGSGSSMSVGDKIIVGSPAMFFGGGQSTGTLCVSDGASITAGGGVYVGLGGELCGDGTVNGNLTNDSGTVAPGNSPGALTITGDYNQDTQGTLQVELSGVGFGEYDSLSIGGAATLGGTLEVVLSNGYVPSPGDSFTFLMADSITGEFSNIILPPNAGDAIFNVVINDDFAVITINSATTPVTPLPVIVDTNIEGSNDSLTVEIEVSLNTIFTDSPLLKMRSTKNTATFDVFVGALVPGEAMATQDDDGQDAWFLLDSAEVWGQFLGGPLPEFLRNAEVNSADHRVVLHLLRSADVSQFIGTTFFIGYGTSDTEMVESGRYRSIFIIEE